MTSRKIDGTKHIRRKLRTRVKIAISVAVLAVVSLGGIFFINTTDKGAELKEKISQMSEIGELHSITWFGEGPGGTSGKIGTTVQVSAYSAVEGAGASGNSIGYVSGLGSLLYGESGNSTVISAKPFAGYKFIRWEIDGVAGGISTNSDLTVKYGDNYGVSGDVVTITESTKFKAVFEKEEVVKATSNYANEAFFFLDMYPAMGTQYITADFTGGTGVGDGENSSGHYSYYYYSDNPDDKVTSVTARISMTYAEAIAAFPYDMKTHTHSNDGDSDSYTSEAYIKGAFDVYIKKGTTEYMHRVTRNVTVDPSDDSKKVVFDFKYPSFPELTSTTDYGTQGENIFFKIVPISQQGTSYQVITKSEDTKKGTTAGDSSSGKPFSTTITATPKEGYEFDYWTKSGIDGEESDPYSKESKLQVKCEGIEIYTAYFKEAKYKVTANNVLPSDGGTVTGTGEFKWHDNVDLTLTPAPGYRVENWSYTTSKGGTYSGSTDKIHIEEIEEDINVTVKFTNGKARIDVKASPVDGGSVTVENKTSGGGAKKSDYEEFIPGKEDAELVATPASGNTFLYWKDSKGNIYNGVTQDDKSNVLTLNKVASSDTFTAYFAPVKITIKTSVYPDNTAGGVEVTGATQVDPSDPSKGYTAEPNTSVTLKANEATGYHFQKFVDDSGKEYQSNPLVKSDLVKDTTFTAIFVPDEFTISVQSSPENGGRVTINGVESSVDVGYGDHVKIEAKPNDGYTFKYFKDALGNEFLSNPLEFDAINGSEKYTAYFAKNDVNITIDLAPAGAGTVRFNSEPAVSDEKTYPTNGASSVTLTATPKDDYKFLYWKDQDGNTYPDNPLVVVNISTDLKFTAVFDSKYDTIRAVASPASGGKITKIINDDGSITLIATANRGYKFTSWKKPNGSTFAFKFTIPADQVHTGDTYIAYFKIIPGYDMKSDITKEKFYREWRKVITPNYTVTRDYMQLLAMQSVAGLRQYDDATPGLKGYGAIANARAYFDERVAKDIERLDGVFGDSELMTAEGEVLTPDLLPDADNHLAVAEKFTDKKFGDRYDTEILTVKRVLEPENFNNDKRTYLWRYTGAEYKDNIYLLYNINGDKHEWATPIVDEDGVLKFTMDKLENNDVVAVVRVKIK